MTKTAKMKNPNKKQTLGIIIPVGEDGTVVLPLDKLEFAGIKPGGKVEVFSDAYGVFIRTADEDEECDVCGMNNGKTRKIGELDICPTCLAEISKKSKE